MRLINVPELKLVLIHKIHQALFCNKDYIFGPYLANLYINGSDKIFYDYYSTNRISEINEFPNYYKFIANRKGEIFATPTGEMVKYYYLETGEFKHDHFSSFIKTINIIDFIDKNLFSKCIKAVFLLKKKYKLPRFITYKIILNLCVLCVCYTEKYYCLICGYI